MDWAAGPGSLRGQVQKLLFPLADATARGMKTNVNTILVTLTQGKSWTNTQGNKWGEPVFWETESPVLSLGLQNFPLLVQTHQSN